MQMVPIVLITIIQMLMFIIKRTKCFTFLTLVIFVCNQKINTSYIQRFLLLKLNK